MSTNENWDMLRERLHQVIPGGAHTYSRGDDQYPANAPPLLVSGKGAYVKDTDGKSYLDYGMALRAITLGYADPRVNAAAIAEIEKGNNLTRASLTELRAAETLVGIVPSVEMVKFGKNGSNVTTAAVKIARAFTRRKFVCIPRQHPFFSFDDWFIGTTALKRGVDMDQSRATLVFDYGDMASLQALFDAHPGEIAAVMLEPATTLTPCPPECHELEGWPHAHAPSCTPAKRDFLKLVRALCDKDGALLIFDEMITGFRWDLGGAQVLFDVKPDLTTFGKGMANGFSLAAVGGRREVMEVGAINRPGMERTFLLSTTHGGEMTPLGAFIETMRIYQAENVCAQLWSYGRKLRDGMRAVAAKHGLADKVRMDGPAISLNFLTYDADGNVSLLFRTLLLQEMIRNGVMMPCIAVSQAHGDTELQLTLEALDKALLVYARALNDGVEKHLLGPAVKPVFRSHN